MLSIHKFFTFYHSNVKDVVARHALRMWCYSHYGLGDVIEGTLCSWGHLALFDAKDVPSMILLRMHIMTSHFDVGKWC
jgi:hypothetical protein